MGKVYVCALPPRYHEVVFVMMVRRTGAMSSLKGWCRGDSALRRRGVKQWPAAPKQPMEVADGASISDFPCLVCIMSHGVAPCGIVARLVPLKRVLEVAVDGAGTPTAL